MTNVRKFRELYDMHSHTADEISSLFDSYLSYGYSTRVEAKMKKDGLRASRATIRQVRCGIYRNQEILNYLIKEAQIQKRRLDRAKKQTKSLIQKL